jgi:hypothetical protein
VNKRGAPKLFREGQGLLNPTNGGFLSRLRLERLLPLAILESLSARRTEEEPKTFLEKNIKNQSDK